MRIVWKDSCSKSNLKPIKYRGYVASSYEEGGWVVDIPNDVNIYKNHYCALNAIDNYLGGYGQKGGAKRLRYGLQVIGTVQSLQR